MNFMKRAGRASYTAASLIHSCCQSAEGHRNVHQQVQLTSEGGIASVFCPGMALSSETANGLQCFANSRLILDKPRASLLLEGADIGDIAILGSRKLEQCQ